MVFLSQCFTFQSSSDVRCHSCAVHEDDAKLITLCGCASVHFCTSCTRKCLEQDKNFYNSRCSQCDEPYQGAAVAEIARAMLEEQMILREQNACTKTEISDMPNDSDETNQAAAVEMRQPTLSRVDTALTMISYESILKDNESLVTTISYESIFVDSKNYTPRESTPRIDTFEATEGVVSLQALADMYFDLAEYEKARATLETALQMAETSPGFDRDILLKVLKKLGEALGYLGRIEEQSWVLEAALKTELKALGEYHPTVAQTLAILGSVHGKLGNQAKQQEYQQRATSINEYFAVMVEGTRRRLTLQDTDLTKRKSWNIKDVY